MIVLFGKTFKGDADTSCGGGEYLLVGRGMEAGADVLWHRGIQSGRGFWDRGLCWVRWKKMAV